MLFYQVKVNWFSLSSLSVADAGGADELGVNPALVPERSLYERCQEQLLEVLSALRSSHFSFTCVVRFTFYKLGNRTPIKLHGGRVPAMHLLAVALLLFSVLATGSVRTRG